VLAAAQPDALTTMRPVEPAGFIALPMPSPTPVETAAEPMRIELQRGATTIAVAWPISASDTCAS